MVSTNAFLGCIRCCLPTYPLSVRREKYVNRWKTGIRDRRQVPGRRGAVRSRHPARRRSRGRVSLRYAMMGF